MARHLSNSALRGDRGRPLRPEELLLLRGAVVDELVTAATARRVDVDEVRELGRVAKLVDRRLQTLAGRGRPPSAEQRLEIAVTKGPSGKQGARLSRLD